MSRLDLLQSTLLGLGMLQRKGIHCIIQIADKINFFNKSKLDQPATWLSKAKGILLSKFEECLLFHLSQKVGAISNIRVTTDFGVDDPGEINLLISHVDAER
jgi:hypothetical protein